MRPTQKGPLAGSVVNMDKNLKKVATYGIAEYTPICGVKTARENLKDCKSYIVDDAVDAFESTTLHVMTAVEYIKVECGPDVTTVSCAGYVWTDVRMAARWWFCYCVDNYSGKRSLLVLDGDDMQHDYKL